MCVEETLNANFNEISSLKIVDANVCSLRQVLDVPVKTNPAGTQKSVSQDYGCDIVIPQYKVTTTTRAADVQNSCQSSATAESTVVDQTSATTLSLTSVDKNPSTLDKNQHCAIPIPPPPFQTDVGSSKSPTDVSSDDSHL
ncbi:hypothetical protein Hanom_Chr12g01108981 [Helianthus anomalus]